MSIDFTDRHKGLIQTGAVDAFLGLLVICATIYVIPAMIGQGKRNAAAIFVLNLLLGWTLVGWAVALVWATAAAEAPPIMEARYR